MDSDDGVKGDKSKASTSPLASLLLLPSFFLSRLMIPLLWLRREPLVNLRALAKVSALVPMFRRVPKEEQVRLCQCSFLVGLLALAQRLLPWGLV